MTDMVSHLEHCKACGNCRLEKHCDAIKKANGTITIWIFRCPLIADEKDISLED